MTRRFLMVLTAAALGTAPAEAATFEGSCAVPFEATNHRPMSGVPQPGGYDAVGRGTCSGLLAGKAVSDEPVSAEMTVEDRHMGCMSGYATGKVTVLFERSRRALAVTFFNPVPSHQTVVVEGDRGGSGAGYYTAYTRVHEQDPSTGQRCVEGSLETWKGEWRLLATRKPFRLGKAKRMRVFEGSCDVVGKARADVPMGVVPVRGGYSFAGDGTCTGTLDGETVEAIPVQVEARNDDRTLGCASGASTSEAILRFPSGRAMRLRGVHPGPAALLEGRYGGHAAGVFTVLTELGSYSPETVPACAQGTADGEGAMRWSVRTITPLRG